MQRPFAGASSVAVVPPPEDLSLGGTRALLELEPYELHALLGAPGEIVDCDPRNGPRWLFLLDSTARTPTIAFDSETDVIRSTAADADGLLESMNLLPTLIRTEADKVEATDCTSLGEVADRVRAEVADTYPAFELRGLDWDEICRRHMDGVASAVDPVAPLQAWVAELQDAHTWVLTRPPPANLPYSLRLDREGATFVRVGQPSAGASHALEPGWRLVALDDAEVDVAGWLARTSAPPHSRPYIAGRRLLQAAPGLVRSLVAESPNGVRVAWTEPTAYVPFEETVTWRPLDDSTGYLRIEAWVAGGTVEDALDAALADLRGRERLVLDLRANPGGNLVLACKTRSRFLRRETALGTIRCTTGGGGVSEPFPMTAVPAAPERRWRGELVVLTDPLTYSSSEDFLLGLQGLDHVRVVGRPSGGGSGRPRSLRLLPGWQLTISTALTYDRNGRCIEGAGIPVDLSVPTDLTGRDDHVLASVL